MCNYKILAHNDEGYIILCKGCNNYQLAFGTTAVTFKNDDFCDFCLQAMALNDTHCCNGFEKDKRIHVDIYNKTALMILNFRELKKLNELISEAIFTGELEKLLVTNQIKGS